MTMRYVHGYGAGEHQRLHDQANALVELLHGDVRYASGTAVLEVGCGVGAQTLSLAARSPSARFTCVDISEASLDVARARVASAGLANVEFRNADALALPFPDASFDHGFVCFVLEHLRAPERVVTEIRRVLRHGASLTIIEGDHGLTAFHPDHPAARAAIECQVHLQREAGGNALIGRTLYPLLRSAGFAEVSVRPLTLYVDGGRPQLAADFTMRTFTAMIEGVRGQALDAGLIDEATFDEGIRALRRTTEPDGTFCYTFFKAIGFAPSAENSPLCRHPPKSAGEAGPAGHAAS